MHTDLLTHSRRMLLLLFALFCRLFAPIFLSLFSSLFPLSVSHFFHCCPLQRWVTSDGKKVSLDHDEILAELAAVPELRQALNDLPAELLLPEASCHSKSLLLSRQLGLQMNSLFTLAPFYGHHPFAQEYELCARAVAVTPTVIATATCTAVP
eukprot:615462-Pleurochrysis_carterae.AAC.1